MLLKLKNFWRGIACIFVGAFTLFALVLAGFYSMALDYESSHNEKSKQKIGDDYVYVYGYEDYSSQKGTIKDRNGKKLVKNVENVAFNRMSDIALFTQNQRVGMFNYKTGKVIIPAKDYVRINKFREGRTLAETSDSIYILNELGERIGNSFKKHDYLDDECCFFGSHLALANEDGNVGIIDTLGRWCVVPTFDNISFQCDQYWALVKNIGDGMKSLAIMDSTLNKMMEMECSHVEFAIDEKVLVSDKNHWQRRYDFDGTLLDDFVCSQVETLEFSNGKKEFRNVKSVDSYGDDATEGKWIDVYECANLIAYRTTDNWWGLMTSDGKPVTAPIYRNIRALNKNSYLCSYSDYSCANVIVRF